MWYPMVPLNLLVHHHVPHFKQSCWGPDFRVFAQSQPVTAIFVLEALWIQQYLLFGSIWGLILGVKYLLSKIWIHRVISQTDVFFGGWSFWMGIGIGISLIIKHYQPQEGALCPATISKNYLNMMSKLKTHGTLGSESVFSPQAPGANCGSIDAPTTWPLPFLECEWVANGTSVPYVIIWVFEEHQVESLVATADVRRFDLPALNHVSQIGWCFETYTGRHRFTTRRRGCGLRAMWLQRGPSLNLPQSLQDPFVLNEPSEASPTSMAAIVGWSHKVPKNVYFAALVLLIHGTAKAEGRSALQTSHRLQRERWDAGWARLSWLTWREDLSFGPPKWMV